jgi:hypothetical protein
MRDRHDETASTRRDQSHFTNDILKSGKQFLRKPSSLLSAYLMHLSIAADVPRSSEHPSALRAVFNSNSWFRHAAATKSLASVGKSSGKFHLQRAFNLKLVSRPRAMRLSRIKPTGILPFLYPQTCRCSYSTPSGNAWSAVDSSIEAGPPKLSREMEAVIAARQSQGPALKRQTPVRSAHEGTMTLGERERFSKIFETILSTKASPSVPKDETTISFHPNAQKDALEPSTSVIDGENTASEKAARAYLQVYPPVLRQEAEQAVANLKQRKLARQRQAKSTALRTAPLYCELKAQLFACEDLLAIEHFVQESLFEPFARKEIDLADKAKRKASMAFCNAYPLLLSDVMKIYRLSYYDHAAAVGIFERIKTHGITSIVIGANTLVYNELMAARWEGWRDVDDILATLEEMERNGVRWDDGTANLLKKVSYDILTESRAEGGAGLYWQSEDPVKLESLNKVQSSIVLENLERTRAKLQEVQIEDQ